MECSNCGKDQPKNMLFIKTRIIENPLYGGEMEDERVLGCYECACHKCHRTGVELVDAFGVLICERCV